MLIITIVVMAWRYRRQLGHSPALAITALVAVCVQGAFGAWTVTHRLMPAVVRSEEHTSELQSLMRNSYAVFCLKKKNNKFNIINLPTLYKLYYIINTHK